MIILGMNMKNANTQFPSSDSNTVSSSVYRMICSPRPHQLPSCSIYSSKENAFKRKKGKLQGKARPGRTFAREESQTVAGQGKTRNPGKEMQKTSEERKV